MSLKTDYYDGATGLNTKVNDSFDLGVAWVTTNLTTISTNLKAQAAKGMATFSMSIATSDNLANMMDNNADNKIAYGYLAGVQKGLADQDLYFFEVVPVVSGTTASAYVQLNFTM